MAKSKRNELEETSSLIQGNLNALIASNIGAFRRQMTHDRVVERLKPLHVKMGRSQIGWDRLSGLMKTGFELKKRVEDEIARICDSEGWHVQGHETDFPEASLKAVAASSGIGEARLKQVIYADYSQDSLGNQLTLAEALALSAAFNVSIQHLLTPPWWAMHEIMAGFQEVDYLKLGQMIPTDRWISWLYGWEPLPTQEEFLFERNMSYPPPLGERLDEAGRKIHRNRNPDFPEINKFNADGLFSKGSWYRHINKHYELGRDVPSLESSTYPDQHPLFRHLSASFLTLGILVHIRKVLRVARRPGRWTSIDKFWDVMVANIAQLLGRLVRVRRQQGKF